MTQHLYFFYPTLGTRKFYCDLAFARSTAMVRLREAAVELRLGVHTTEVFLASLLLRFWPFRGRTDLWRSGGAQ